MTSLTNNYASSDNGEALYDYSLCQLAGEAFLNNVVNPSATLAYNSYEASFKDALILGNKHTSKFTETDANYFVKNFELVSTVGANNTNTGFSCALFKKKGTEEYVLSLRSTEFIDDYARDNAATNTLELKEHGYAFGQIADMQSFISNALSSGKLPANANLTVTGYSLGGSLAAACAELYPELVDQVYTFNGAGIGQLIDGTSLSQVMTEFSSYRNKPVGYTSEGVASAEDPNSLRFGILAECWPVYREEADALFGNLFAYLGNSANLTDFESVQSKLEGFKALYDKIPNSNVSDSVVGRALSNMAYIAQHLAIISKLKSGVPEDEGPEKYTLGQIAQFDFGYQVAMLTAAKNTKSYHTLGGASNMINGQIYKADQPSVPVYNVVGYVDGTIMDRLSMVSYSQWHLGSDATQYHIPIEAQPLSRGLASVNYPWASAAEQSVILISDNYSENDFGDTHSIVLMIDSLYVQKTLAQYFDVFKSTSAYHELLLAASTTQWITKSGTQGVCDGSALENILNTLTSIYLPGEPWLRGNTRGGTWAEISSRQAVQDRLSLLSLKLEEFPVSPDGQFKLISDLTKEDLINNLCLLDQVYSYRVNDSRIPMLFVPNQAALTLLNTEVLLNSSDAKLNYINQLKADSFAFDQWLLSKKYEMGHALTTGTDVSHSTAQAYAEEGGVVVQVGALAPGLLFNKLAVSEFSEDIMQSLDNRGGPILSSDKYVIKHESAFENPLRLEGFVTNAADIEEVRVFGSMQGDQLVASHRASTASYILGLGGSDNLYDGGAISWLDEVDNIYLAGGTGSDTYYVNNTTHVHVIETDSSTATGGVDTAIVTVSYELAENVENGSIKLSDDNKNSDIVLTGNALSNNLSISAALVAAQVGGYSNLVALNGGGGNDVLVSTSGTVWLAGGEGKDSYLAASDNYVYDSDNEGKIVFEGVKLKGGKWDSTNKYFRDPSNGITYSLTRSETQGYLLQVKSLKTQNQFYIKLLPDFEYTGVYEDSSFSLSKVLDLTLEGDAPSTAAGKPLKDLTPDAFKAAAALTGRRWDPLVIDLDRDGKIATVGTTEGVYFDYDGNGVATKSGWVKPTEGLVVRDLNGNGGIESGAELMSDMTKLSNGLYAVHGFAALKDMDSNADNKVDLNDTGWNTLKVWQDADLDGITDEGELHTLDYYGIKSLNTLYTAGAVVDPLTQNVMAERSTVTYLDGSTGLVADINFAQNSVDTVTLNEFDPELVDAETAQFLTSLPSMVGTGNVMSFKLACAQFKLDCLKY